MTKVKDIYEYIDSFAPFDTAEEWDNVGVLVGDKSAEVTKALLALDITNDVVEEAHKSGAQLIISHHPVIFGGLKKLPSSSPVYKAAVYGIACLCAHTNLDRSPVFGVNTALAEAAGLVDCERSEAGVILFTAKTKEPLTPEQLAAQLKERFSMGAVSFTSRGDKITKVGLSSGGGGGEIFAAASQGCDAFITGEIKHHELIFANENGISTFILGHYKSEDVVLEPLAKKLSEVFTDAAFIKSAVFTDGVGVI